MDFCFLWIDSNRGIPQLTHKCFDIVKMSVLEKFVDGWAAGMWKITGLAFSHKPRHHSPILRQRQQLATTFCRRCTYVCVWMNWCWLMTIEDPSIDDNTNLGPCIFAILNEYVDCQSEILQVTGCSWSKMSRIRSQKKFGLEQIWFQKVSKSVPKIKASKKLVSFRFWVSSHTDHDDRHPG